MANLERREFIKKTILGSLGTMLLTDVTANNDSQSPGTEGDWLARKNGVSKKVIIGGAGISGLCCAMS